MKIHFNKHKIYGYTKKIISENGVNGIVGGDGWPMIFRV